MCLCFGGLFARGRVESFGCYVKISMGMDYDYNINIILEMDQKQKRIKEFFMSVKDLPSESIHSPYINLSSFLVLKHSAQNQNKIELKDNLLLVSTLKQGVFQYTYGLFLQDGIKFQRIHRKINSIQDQNKLLGFRLINSQQQYLNIHIAFEELVHIWLRELSKHINQVGFHQVYKTVRKIGRGSTATVFQIHRIVDGQIFAAKVILKAYLLQKEQRMKALNQEISFLRVIDHQNIIKLHGVFQSEQAIYLIFDRLEGGNMVERLNKHKRFQLDQIRQIMRGIAEGLAYLHKFGIAHRDIKLENIIFKDQNSLQPVIADLGLAIFTQDEPYLYYKCGTPGYVAPEIIRMKENKKIKTVCDIFSAGVIFHVLLTNKYLFDGENHKEVHRLNLQSQINLQAQPYSEIDSQALSLLKMMLAIKVSNRITADEILEHSFLEFYSKQKDQVSPAVTEVGQIYQI